MVLTTQPQNFAFLCEFVTIFCICSVIYVFCIFAFCVNLMSLVYIGLLFIFGFHLYAVQLTTKSEYSAPELTVEVNPIFFPDNSSFWMLSQFVCSKPERHQFITHQIC